MFCRFAEPFIHDILAAYEKYSHNARATVAYLQRTFPKLVTESAPRFADLHESTIRSWYGKDGELLDRFRSYVLAERSAAPRGVGELHMFAEHEDVEAEAGRILIAMRERGAIINRLVAQHILRIVIEQMAPELLQEYKISLSFISKWLHHRLGWAPRMKTSAASKLPLDWKAQGTLMAKRVAFHLQVHKVHLSLIVNMDQTGLNLAPADVRTFAPKGEDRSRRRQASDHSLHRILLQRRSPSSAADLSGKDTGVRA